METVRVQRFKANFWNWRHEGISVSEMAKICKIHDSYAYVIMKQMAEESGIPYEKFLYQVHFFPGPKKAKEDYEMVDIDELISEVDELLKEVDCFVNETNKMLERSGADAL